MNSTIALLSACEFSDEWKQGSVFVQEFYLAACYWILNALDSLSWCIFYKYFLICKLYETVH